MEQKDFVQFGSEQHAALLGLRKLGKNEEAAYSHDGYTLVDPTAWGPNARAEFIQAQLIQKVNELKTRPSVPSGALPLWTPTTE